MIHSERLASFLAFGQALNFTRAAQQMHISQPSLFAQIKKLESELDTKLYEKHGRYLSLTRAGQQLLAHAREVERRDGQIRARLSGTEPDTPLVLAAGEGALLYLLPDALARLQKSHGGRIRVLTRNATDTIRSVVLGEATLGVTALSGPHSGVESTSLTLVGLQAVFSKSHSLAKKRSLGLSSLDGAPLVSVPRGFPHRENLEKLFAGAELRLNVVTEANGWTAMMHLASLGLGIALVNDFCKPPRGCVGRPIRNVPKLEYRVLWRQGDASSETELMRRAVLTKAG